jgi:hypothetical protein
MEIWWALCFNLKREEKKRESENCKKKEQEKEKRVEKILWLPFVLQTAQCLLQHKSINITTDSMVFCSVTEMHIF